MKMRTLALLGLTTALALGCRNKNTGDSGDAGDTDTDSGHPVVEDLDDDGYTEAEGDCDDSDASVNPGATEVWYDGTDSDCAGDDDFDADADGYAQDVDCDETDPAVHPGATETWYDGVDSDCAGDDDFDADSDSWTDGEDCDDGDPLVNPDADEICDDGVDNDCDGHVSGCGIWQDQSVGNATATLYGDAGAARLGQGDPGVAAAGDLDGDGQTDLVVSAIFDSTVERRQGAVYLVSGMPGASIDNIGNVAHTKLVGDDANDWAGYAVAGAGDVDGDGQADLFVGATRDDTSGTDAGISFVLLGPVDGDAVLADRADAAWTGASAGEISGELSWVGDFDGDGLDDLLVGAQWAGDNNGAAYLVFGPATSGGSLAAADLVLSGENADDEASSSLSGVGDLDGDGLNDLAVGARNADLDGENSGGVYVVLGGRTGSHSLASADSVLMGEGAGAEVGWGVSIAGAGDTDGDGYDDMIIGARNDSDAATNAGAAYIVQGPVADGMWSLSLADAKLLGETADDFTGDSVGGAGDVDGDGFSDVVVGSGYSSLGAEEGGAAYVLRGPLTGTSSLADADGIIRAAAAQDRLRTRGAGDLDNDGLDDIVVTAQLADDGDEADAGAIYLFPGSGM